MQIAQKNFYKKLLGRVGEKKAADFLRKKGIWFTGGESSPYIWLECPGGKSSGDFFDFLLATTRIVGTPGAGFGSSGEGYFRFSCFATEDKVAEAVRRMDAVL